MRPSTRRELVAATAATAFTAAIPPAWGARLRANARVGPGSFRDGVASGEPGRKAVTFWSRISTERPHSGARLIVARDEGMRRVVVPGRMTITLPAGTSTLYAEQRSVVGGKHYKVEGDFKYRCGIDEPARPVTLQAATAEVTYSIGDYTGRNAWDVEVREAGDYTLVCESDRPFVMAVGRGVGSAIVVAIVGIVPFTIGLGVILLVFFRRRKQRRATTT